MPTRASKKHRGAQDKPGEYFGPFASVGALNETMALLQKIFQLRPCSDSYFKNRTRPCLQYQIKRCSAPCVNYISEDTYAEQLIRARDFLKGRHRDVQDALSVEMLAASEAMEFERAATLRDQIRVLTRIQQEQGLRTAGLTDADVIALARRGAKSIVQVSFYRQGSHFGQQSFHPTHEADATDGEVMAAFLAQFYQAHTPPPEILVNLMPDEVELLCEALRINTTYAITIRVPLKGDKLTLVKNAAANAETALARAEMEHAAIAGNLVKLQALLGPPPFTATDRGLRQQPYQRAKRRRCVHRRHAGWVRQAQLPHLHHQRRNDRTRRRLRHDARSLPTAI